MEIKITIIPEGRTASTHEFRSTEEAVAFLKSDPKPIRENRWEKSSGYHSETPYGKLSTGRPLTTLKNTLKELYFKLKQHGTTK